MRKYEILYQQLCEEITQRLQGGDGVLPGEMQMCAQYGVSRQTLRRALARLKEEHIVASRQGSGYTLTGRLPAGTNRIALLVPSKERYTFPALIAQVTRLLGQMHFQTDVYVTRQDVGAERQILEELIGDAPRGMIAFCCGSGRPSPNADLYQALYNKGTRIVFASGRCPNILCGESAETADEQGGEALAEYLLSLGHTRLAFLMEEGDAQGQDIYLGGVRALLRRGFPLSEEDVKRIPPSVMDRIRSDRTSSVMNRILSMLPEDATAVICQNDELAFFVIRALRSRGIQVPAQISVAGFDDSHLRAAGRIPLTTMARTPLLEADYVCAALRHLLTGSSPVPPGNLWRLVPGASTAPRSAGRM